MSRSDPAPVVAFQGEAGAYSERAIARLFPAGARTRGKREARDAAAAVERGEADHALLPIENTLAGSVPDTLAVLADTGLRVVAETILPIHHALLGMEGTDVDAVKRVLSHPIALAQCARFVRSRPGVRAESAYDTAGAAHEVARAGDRTLAAIAGEWVAETSGLAVIARDIEDRADNQTRFLLLAAPPPDSAKGGRAGPIAATADETGRRPPMKTMLLVEVDNRPGALVGVLSAFAERRLNLSWLESRPTGQPWTYRFFMDLDADADDERTAAALGEVRRRASLLRVLGSFPREERTGR
ncbi:MAG TPA: prephenate dehydratase [Longimicrobiales bacterium]|nr:prephenate dehydratase [Longimicrobiales bacterium]